MFGVCGVRVPVSVVCVRRVCGIWLGNREVDMEPGARLIKIN